MKRMLRCPARACAGVVVMLRKGRKSARHNHRRRHFACRVTGCVLAQCGKHCATATDASLASLRNHHAHCTPCARVLSGLPALAAALSLNCAFEDYP
jgi:hypothetical protein